MPTEQRVFLELSPDMACVLDLDGRMSACNAAWEERLGTPSEEVSGRSLADLVHERDRGRIAAALGRLAEGRAITDAHTRFLHKDGGFRWISWSAKPQLDMGLIFTAARQIGDGTMSIKQIKAIMDGTTDFIGLAELTGDVLYVNPNGMAMVGRAGESYLGLNTSDLRTEKAVRQSTEVIRPTALRNGVWSGETEYIGPGGRTLTMWQVFVVLHNEDGEPEAFASMARDISDKKLREQELRRFKAILDSTSDFVAVCSTRGGVQYINAAGLKLIGRASEDPKSLNLRSLFTEESAARFAKGVRAAIEAGGTWSGDPELVHVDGHSIPTSCVVMSLTSEDGRPAEIAIVARDITSHRRADALQTAIRAMSTPILEIWSGVLALPVIGGVDGGRAAEMTEALLNAIVRTRCRVAILDLTGMDVVDTSTISHLFKMVSAASLLGSACVVSGISPYIAQTIAGLGLDLSKLRSFRSLQEALAFALKLA